MLFTCSLDQHSHLFWSDVSGRTDRETSDQHGYYQPVLDGNDVPVSNLDVALLL